jgi:hypothetical protein
LSLMTRPDACNSPTDLSVKACSDGRFERFVIFSILQRTDHRLGREPMTDGANGQALSYIYPRLPWSANSCCD